MEKRIEVFTARGHKVRVVPSMLRDIARFDAFPVKKTVKEAPKELMMITPVNPMPSNLPQMELSNQEPEGQFEKPPRKVAVRSKTK
jgi:hypothetical protein